MADPEKDVLWRQCKKQIAAVIFEMEVFKEEIV